MADVSRFIAKADEALKKRNYDYAIQMYQSAMEADPGNAEARKNYRLALVRKYDSVGYPKSLGLGGMATKMISGKNPEKLLVETEKLIEKDPKSLKYNLRVAETLAAMKHHDGAVAVLEFATRAGDLKKDKQAPNVLKLYAKMLAQVGRVEDANKALGRATRLAPNDKEIKQLQKDMSAQTHLDKFKSASAGGISSRDMLRDTEEADLLEKMRRGMITEEDAQTLLRQEENKLKEQPLDRRAIRNIGEILAKRKKYKEAYQRLHQFMEVDPSASEIGDIAAKYMTNYFDSMIQLCAKKAQSDPAKAAAYQAKANEIREEKKKFQLDEYGRQVEAAPTDLEKRFEYGKALLEAEQFDTAFKQFQKATKSPKFAKHSWLRAGECLVHMHRIEMAEMAFKNVEKLIGEGDGDLRKDLLYFEADLMEKKGEKVDALDKFRSLYMEEMDFRDVESRIERLRMEVSGA